MKKFEHYLLTMIGLLALTSIVYAFLHKTHRLPPLRTAEVAAGNGGATIAPPAAPISATASTASAILAEVATGPTPLPENTSEPLPVPEAEDPSASAPTPVPESGAPPAAPTPRGDFN